MIHHVIQIEFIPIRHPTPLFYSDSSNASLTMTHHPRYKNNVAHASVQTSDTMTTNSHSSSEQLPQEKHPWLPIPINENTSRLCQIRPSVVLTTLQQSFLPVFPICSDADEFYPLLANIPLKELSTIEQRLRQAHRFDDNYANMLLKFDVKLRLDVQQWLDSYARQWNIHQIILMINLNRLFHLLSRFTLQDYFIKKQEESYELSMEEWFMILEFYLQMDVSCFYMKTCTFRNSKRHWNYTGLFCNVEPKAYYDMKKCEDRNCRFCYERSDLTKRLERAMNFSNKQIHRFVNNYQVYLNCDV
ncbi:unnamed protein product, partial [Rotaria sp. Silwood2]